MACVGCRSAILAAAGVAMVVLAGCSYGPVHTAVDLGNAVVRPGSHVFAMSGKWQHQRDPEGFVATFPDGGKPQVLGVEARVYVVDVDRRVIARVAQIPGFAGIPQPKQVWIEGWNEGHLYFTLFGYGGSLLTGDDLSDERRLHFRVTSAGEVGRVSQLPAQVHRQPESGPLGDPPFLRLSKGHSEIVVGVDGPPLRSMQGARITLDLETGEPRFDDDG